MPGEHRISDGVAALDAGGAAWTIDGRGNETESAPRVNRSSGVSSVACAPSQGARPGRMWRRSRPSQLVSLDLRIIPPPCRSGDDCRNPNGAAPSIRSLTLDWPSTGVA